jgi:hypothetical protein
MSVLSVLGSKVENWRGKMDKNFLMGLEAEGINYDSGKVRVSFSADNIRGKGFYVSKAKQLARGKIIITGNRLVAIVGGFKMIDIPKDHPLFSEIVFDFNTPKHSIIEVKYDNFPNDYTGLISMNYQIPPENMKEWI